MSFINLMFILCKQVLHATVAKQNEIAEMMENLRLSKFCVSRFANNFLSLPMVGRLKSEIY